MPNEILLLLSLVICFGATLVFYRLFGAVGLYCSTRDGDGCREYRSADSGECVWNGADAGKCDVRVAVSGYGYSE